MDNNTTKNKIIDIKELLNVIVEKEFSIAEERLSEDSNSSLIIPSVYAITDKGINVIMLPFDDESKGSMLKSAGRKCYEWKCHQIALIADVAYKHYEEKDIDDTELPLTYPQSMRSDALLLQYVDLKNKDNNTVIISPYSIENNKIIRKKCEYKNEDELRSRLIYHLLIGFMSYFLKEKTSDIPIESLDIDDVMTIGDELVKIYPGLIDAPVITSRR